MKPLPTLLFALIASAWSPASAEPKPAELLAQYMKTPMLHAEGSFTGEALAWHAAWRAERWAQLARETGDAAYADSGVTYFDALLAKTMEAPDGYRGWVGTYIYDKNLIADHHIADAILVNPMLALAEFILNEADPQTRERLSDSAREYIRYAERNLIEKWLARGTWWDDGVFGGFFYWDHYLSADHSRWVEMRDANYAHYGLPFNKNIELGITLLRLNRLTGKPEYRQRAQMIFDMFKSRLNLFKNGYTWNYWEPVFPDDIRSFSPPVLSHWVGTHSYRDYQLTEIENIVEVYHSGLTFTREDMERFVATNMEMWNGSFDNPDFVNSDFAVRKAADPSHVEPPPSPAFGGPAGTAWGPLAEFCEAIGRLAGEQHSSPPLPAPGQVDTAIEGFPYASSRMFAMAFAMPSRASAGEQFTLCSKQRAAGELRILLMTEDGSKELKQIHAGTVESSADDNSGNCFVRWEAPSEPGNYRIRWITGKDYRDFPIQVE